MWRVREEALQKKWTLLHLWVGPIFHVVYIYNPEDVKKVLKGRWQRWAVVVSRC